MSRILWLGDAGCHTGFARVTHAIGERLVEMGHEVSVLAVNYDGDYVDTTLRLYRPTTINQQDIYGQTRILEMLATVEPDVVVMLNDPQVILQHLFENKFDPERILLQYRPILTYVPCDGVNLPPAWTTILPKVAKVVAMSKWGQQQYPGSEMVYHGVDTDQFWPVHERPITTSDGRVLKSKKDCKRAFGFDPDGFLVGRVDSNSGRKDFPASWKALVPLMKRYGDIQVHFHCESSNAAHGINLQVLFSREPDIDVSRYFLPGLHRSGHGWPQADMNALYNAFDVFLSTSRGEGFGLTLAEASACAVPVIAQNVSAIPETVGPGGILLEPQRLITVPSGEDNWLADIDAFTDALESLYRSRGARRDLGEAGLKHVRESFSWDEAASRFDEYIGTLVSGTDTSEERVA